MTESVSVIIPVLNGASHLRAAVHSALGQSHGPAEVVVADNGSTDDTWAVVEELAAADRRIVPLRVAARGVAFARNACLDVVRGEWIAVLDADDRMDRRRLERLLGFAKEREAAVVADNLRLLDSDGRFLGEAWRRVPDSVDAATYLDRNRRQGGRVGLGYCKPVFRRALIEATGLRYRTSLSLGEDSYFLFSLIRAGGRLHLSPEALYHYVQMPGSLSRQWGESHSRALLAEVEADLARGADDPAVAAALSRLGASLVLQQKHFAFVRAVKQRHFHDALALCAGTPEMLPRIATSGWESLTKRLSRLQAALSPFGRARSAMPPWVGEA